MALSKDYWQGYRDARIAVLFNGLESTQRLTECDYGHGWNMGLIASRKQLNSLIKKDKEIERSNYAKTNAEETN